MNNRKYCDRFGHDCAAVAADGAVVCTPTRAPNESPRMMERIIIYKVVGPSEGAAQ